MNKKGFLKALMLGFVIAIAVGFVTSQVMAQVIPTQIMVTSPYVVPLDCDGQVMSNPNTPVTALVDNFEYWNNPRNMGWIPEEPPYPVWGAGLGMANLNCLLDFEQGSKVLDVYRPMSVFLMNTPYSVLQIRKMCGLPNGKPIPGANSAMSLEIRAPLALEQFDSFAISVACTATSSGGDGDCAVTIVFVPYEGPQGFVGIMNQPDEIEDGTQIVFYLGRMFQDGSWHLVSQDLAADIIDVYDPGATLDTIEMVGIRGNQYRIDNIMFVRPENSIAGNSAVHLFHIGPVYCQLYGQLSYLDAMGRWIFAEDADLGLTCEPTADNTLLFPQIFDVVSGKALEIPIDDPNDYGKDSLYIFEIDPNGDRVDRDDDGDVDTDDAIGPDDADLEWTFTMGDTLGPVINDQFVRKVDLDVSSASLLDADDVAMMPPYLLQEDGVLIQMAADPNGDVDVLANPIYAVACALVNSGYDTFPNAVRITPNVGQVFEDMIVTCRVDDGVVTDKETFPVSVVNFPMTNYPPIINDVDDQMWYVGQRGIYPIVAVDPDMQDMRTGLTFRATLNGLSNYQYGPWMDNIMDPCRGILSFVPQFEGALDCIVTVLDPRGMSAVCAFTIFCVNAGTWFNHPPIVLGDLDSPQTIRAGEKFVADEMDFRDPDGDKLYWSCNIGSVGNNGVYTFQSQFPGYYLVQITAYDIRGGAATTEFVIHVKPWWSL